ncbi:MAG TPA: FAD:protein FMN transferase [Steroidobacteraceae bacterium]|nr:FAD:protein FMN transferase [Steroidobacteraceae bacterium]
MGTTYTVKVVDAPADLAPHSIQKTVDSVLDEIDVSMSEYRADSEISRFNASRSTDWFAVSSDLLRVVQSAQQVASESNGAFDITVGPLVDAWGFGPEHTQDMPTAEQLQAIAARIGYRKLEVRSDPAAIRKQVAELEIDVNGIAPGYAVDLLSKRFEQLGLENYVIDIGGEVLARGHNAQGDPWRIAIERPTDERSAPFGFVALRDASVTTSGEYRHYYYKNGKRYSHTIDPRTRSPVEHDLAAVVVAGPTTTQIDAWATALNVLGAEAGLHLARERHIAAMFIRDRGGTLNPEMTQEFRPYLAQAER